VAQITSQEITDTYTSRKWKICSKRKKFILWYKFWRKKLM